MQQHSLAVAASIQRLVHVGLLLPSSLDYIPFPQPVSEHPHLNLFRIPFHASDEYLDLMMVIPYSYYRKMYFLFPASPYNMENFTNSQVENYIQAGKRLRLVRGRLGISQKEFSGKLGVKIQKLADMESGRVRIPVEIADFLHVNFSIDFRWLLTGDGCMEKNTENESIQPSQEQPGYCRISMIEGRLPDGRGVLFQSEGTEGYCLFSEEWVNRTVSRLENAFLMTVTGNSMEPSIYNNDLVMIDTGRTAIYEGGLFALRMDNSIMIKRLSPRPGDKIKVISDNREYDSYEAERKDIQVIAQVVWVARMLVGSY